MRLITHIPYTWTHTLSVLGCRSAERRHLGQTASAVPPAILKFGRSVTRRRVGPALRLHVPVSVAVLSPDWKVFACEVLAPALSRDMSHCDNKGVVDTRA